MNLTRGSVKFAIKENLMQIMKKNKFKLLLILLITIIALLTGTIIAIRTQSISTFTKFLGDETKTLNGTNFFLRLLSMIVVFTFVIIGSFQPWLCPFALLFIAYRAFLMGGNITLLILLNGLSGVVIGVLVVFPCQLLSLALFIGMYLLLCDGRNYKKCYGCERVKSYWLILILIGLGLILLICLLESLLITMLSPTIIFVF